MSALPGTLPPAAPAPGATSTSGGGRGAGRASDVGFADLLRAALPEHGAGASSGRPTAATPGASAQESADADGQAPTDTSVAGAQAAEALAGSLLAGSALAATAQTGAPQTAATHRGATQTGAVLGTTALGTTALGTTALGTPALPGEDGAAAAAPLLTTTDAGTSAPALLTTGATLASGNAQAEQLPGEPATATVATATLDTTGSPTTATADSATGEIPVEAGNLSGATTGDTGDESGRGTGSDRGLASGQVAGSQSLTGQGTSPATGGGTVDLQGLTPVTGTAAASPATPSGNAASSAPTPVTAQVFGEVSRLAARGDGTHRMTLTLNPEALGEVRVTLTVRQGEVTVSFAAGDEAQRALLEGAPELRRLLELGGATESRIIVRDSAGGPGSHGNHQPQTQADGQGESPSGRAADAGGSDGQDAADARPDTQDHHARMRDGQTATDGTHRGPGATRLPHDPVTSTRAAGLDVTL